MLFVNDVSCLYIGHQDSQVLVRLLHKSEMIINQFRALREWKTEPDPTKTRMRLLRSRPDRVNKSAVQASLPRR